MARASIRSASTRQVEMKDETYSPPFSYDVPEEVRAKFEQDGYHLRWVRVMLDNQDDYKNVADRRREGYEPVGIVELPEEFRDLFETRSLNNSATARYANIAMVGDLALFKIPLGKARARHRYFEQMAAANEAAVMRQLQGSESKLNKLLPIHNESSTTVRVGGRGTTSQAEFGKTLKSDKPNANSSQSDDYEE